MRFGKYEYKTNYEGVLDNNHCFSIHNRPESSNASCRHALTKEREYDKLKPNLTGSRICE